MNILFIKRNQSFLFCQKGYLDSHDLVLNKAITILFTSQNNFPLWLKNKLYDYALQVGTSDSKLYFPEDCSFYGNRLSIRQDV